MAKPTIKLDLHGKTTAQLLLFAASIAQGLRASNLPDKEALALLVEGKAALLETSQNDLDLTMRSIPGKTDGRNLTRDDLGEAFESVVSEVEKELGDDAQAMTAIGFELASTSRTPLVMVKVENLQLTPGDFAGMVDAHWNPVAGTRSYLIHYGTGEAMPASEDAWKNALPASASKTELTNLTSGLRVWVRVAALGAGKNNLGPWSEPAFITVP